MNNNTKFLLLMGGSGCGKTTLAKKLQEFDSEVFYRSIEYGTRGIRNDEIDGYDYYFITNDELLKLKDNDELFESVIYQFPDMYGCNHSEIKDGYVNVVIVSIEGFLTAAKSIKDKYPDSAVILVNILNDCELDIKREGRDPLAEERVNRAVLLNQPNNFIEKDGCFKGKFKNSEWSSNMTYHEMKLSELKKIRNSKQLCLGYFYGLFC